MYIYYIYEGNYIELSITCGIFTYINTRYRGKVELELLAYSLGINEEHPVNSRGDLLILEAYNIVSLSY